MRLLYSILFCALALCAQASTYITATLTITNNPSGTNGQVLTIGSDTRTWTNSVYAAATQVLAGTNATLSAQNLLVHISAHPFTGLTLYGSGTNWLSLRTAADGASPSITVSTNWASVALVTNTVTAAAVLRLPITVEAAAAQTNLASLLAAALNSAANTTKLTQVDWTAFDASGITNVAKATNADYATEAGHSTNSDLATLATQATHATNADLATLATEATHATNADLAASATAATTATNGPNGSALLTGNQSITLSGDVTGSGATSIAATVTNLPLNRLALVSTNSPATNSIVAWLMATFGGTNYYIPLCNTNGL